VHLVGSYNVNMKTNENAAGREALNLDYRWIIIPRFIRGIGAVAHSKRTQNCPRRTEIHQCPWKLATEISNKNSTKFKTSLSHLQQYGGNVLMESMVTDHDTRLHHSTPQTQKRWSARKAIIFSERHKLKVSSAGKVMASVPGNALISGLGAQQALQMPAGTWWSYTQEKTRVRTARWGPSAVQCDVTSLQSRHCERLQRHLWPWPAGVSFVAVAAAKLERSPIPQRWEVEMAVGRWMRVK
jgi:hypothetical protein